MFKISGKTVFTCKINRAVHINHIHNYRQWQSLSSESVFIQLMTLGHVIIKLLWDLLFIIIKYDDDYEGCLICNHCIHLSFFPCNSKHIFTRCDHHLEVTGMCGNDSSLLIIIIFDLNFDTLQMCKSICFKKICHTQLVLYVINISKYLYTSVQLQ